MDRAEQFLYQLGWYKEDYFKRRGYEENKPGQGMPSDDKEFYRTSYKKQENAQGGQDRRHCFWQGGDRENFQRIVQQQ